MIFVRKYDEQTWKCSISSCRFDCWFVIVLYQLFPFICLQLVSSNCDLSNDAGGFLIAVTEIWVILWIRIDWGIRCCIHKVENDVERIRIETSIHFLPLSMRGENDQLTKL